MAWINVLKQDQLDKNLAATYQRLADPQGQVDQVMQIHSLRPHTLEAHLALYKATLHHSNNTLPKWLLECIGVYVSRLNRCEYCDQHHTAGLQRLIKDDKHFTALHHALHKQQPAEPFSPAQQQLLAYVRQLTVAPSDLQQTDVEGLRQAGFSDGQILEANQVAAYFAYVNRSVLGLGVDCENETLGTAPATNDNLDDWRHH